MVKTLDQAKKTADHTHPEYVTHPQLEKAMERQTKDITSVILDFAEQVNARFDAHDRRFDQVDQLLGSIKGKLTAIEADIREIYDQLKDIRRKLRRQNIDVKKMDKRVTKLEKFVKRLAAKAGLPEPKF